MTSLMKPSVFRFSLTGCIALLSTISSNGLANDANANTPLSSIARSKIKNNAAEAELSRLLEHDLLLQHATSNENILEYQAFPSGKGKEADVSAELVPVTLPQGMKFAKPPMPLWPFLAGSITLLAGATLWGFRHSIQYMFQTMKPVLNATTTKMDASRNDEALREFESEFYRAVN